MRKRPVCEVVQNKRLKTWLPTYPDQPSPAQLSVNTRASGPCWECLYPGSLWLDKEYFRLPRGTSKPPWARYKQMWQWPQEAFFIDCSVPSPESAPAESSKSQCLHNVRFSPQSAEWRQRGILDSNSNENKQSRFWCSAPGSWREAWVSQAFLTFLSSTTFPEERTCGSPGQHKPAWPISFPLLWTRTSKKHYLSDLFVRKYR